MLRPPIAQGRQIQSIDQGRQFRQLNDLPARPDLIGRIEVTFSLDKNGILTAKARDNASGKTAEMTIDYDVSNKGSGAQASAA